MHNKQKIENIVHNHFIYPHNIKDLISPPNTINQNLYKLTNKLAENFYRTNNVSIITYDVLNNFSSAVEKLSKQFYISEDFNFKEEAISAELNKKINKSLENIDTTELKSIHVGIALEKQNTSLAVELAKKLSEQAHEIIKLQDIPIPLSRTQRDKIDNLVQIDALFQAYKQDKVQITGYLNNNDHVNNFSTLKTLFNHSEIVSNIKLLDFDKSKSSDLSTNLKESEAKFIRLFSTLSNKKVLIDAEKEYLQKMLERSIGNFDLNKRLSKFAHEKNNLIYKKYETAVNNIKYFSYKTKNIDKILEINSKCRRNLKLLESGQKIDEFEKLSLHEYSVLCDIAKLKNNIEKYKDLGLIPDKGKLADLYANITNSYNLVKEINDRAIQNERYKAGDILLPLADKTHAVGGKSSHNKEAIIHKIMKIFVTKYNHAALISIDSENNTPIIPHIIQHYQVDKLTGQDIIGSMAVRINPYKLISPKNKEILKELYKNPEEVSILYRNIVQKLHETPNRNKFKYVENDSGARYMAGLANFYPGGHTKSKEQDFEKVRDSLLNINDWSEKKKMICSEFVSRNIITAFVELNQKSGEELKKANISFEDKELVKIPIPKNEKISKIHPQRLVELLDAAGCLEKIEPDPIISSLISSSKLYDMPKKQDLSVELYNKMKALADREQSSEKFVKNGEKIFITYLNNQQNLGQDEIKKISPFITIPLRDFYKAYDRKKPETFLEKFKHMLQKISEKCFKTRENKLQNIIKSTIKDIDTNFLSYKQQKNNSIGISF